MSRKQTQAYVVAVVASAEDLERALRLRVPPDLFELRLDAFASSAPDLRTIVRQLRKPLIITARHPREGGFNELQTARRRELLLAFLSLATLVDIELRSADEMREVLERARESGVRRIISVHNLVATPSAVALDNFARAAQEHGADILKLATRVVADDDADRLRDFFERTERNQSVSITPIGRGARRLRLEFARAGSALNYTHLGQAIAEGQCSLAEFRRALSRPR